MRSPGGGTLSTILSGLAVMLPSVVFAQPPAPAPTRPAPRVVAATERKLTQVPAAPVPPLPLDIDVRGLRRHAESVARLIGHPAGQLAAKLGTAAIIDDGAIEWNLVDAGVDAASAYGYATVVDGTVTGFVIRGRAAFDKLRRLHLHGPLQLTCAGGERPSYSIAAGE